MNVFSAWLLRASAAESLNIEGAYSEVLADLVGSVGVVVVAIVYLTTGWQYADPIVAIGIGSWIVPRSLRLGRKALAVLVESAPSYIDLPAICRGCGGVEGVADVHDLHVWTLTSEIDVATVRLVVSENIDPRDVLHAAGDHLRTNWCLAHATLQVEPESHASAPRKPGSRRNCLTPRQVDVHFASHARPSSSGYAPGRDHRQRCPGSQRLER